MIDRAIRRRDPSPNPMYKLVLFLVYFVAATVASRPNACAALLRVLQREGENRTTREALLRLAEDLGCSP